MIVALLVILFQVFNPGDLDWDQQQAVEAIRQQARVYQVDETTMLRVAWCESRFHPASRGDSGRSHGLYQLNDLPTGLVWDFYSRGYDNPYDENQASDYYARVLAGEFAGISPNRWSCR